MRPKDELLQKIRIVRSKWKAFLWLRGLSWVLGVLVASILTGVAVANSPGIPAGAITALRIGFIVVFLFTVLRALVIPLRRTPSDTQLARFVEEKNPGLEDRLVSAVEAVQKPKAEQGAIVHLLIKDALDRTRHLRFGDQVNKRKFGAFAALTVAFAAGLIVSLYIASLFFPIGSARLLAGLIKPPDIDAIELIVTPGDITVPRGSDVVIQAVAAGFDPQRAEIHLRYANGSQWEASTMEVNPQSLPTFRHVLFNVQETVHYFVDSGGYKSKEFRIDAADLPRVEKLDYTYHYPAYTGLAFRKEENAADMIALRGTTVEVQVTGSQALSGGELVFADGKKVPLQPAGEKMVSGRVTVDRATTFRIRLVNTNGQGYLSLEEYMMDALDDQQPIVEFTKPGRDHKATNVEEVFAELRAEDDFGVDQLDLYFSVNGTAEQKVALFANKGEAPKEISAGHTFFLEEYELKPGDFITYYGKAVDTRRPSNSVQTDVYFIEVRPFGREYYQGQQGGGGGGGQDESAEALSKRQKEIIAATYNLIRDKQKFVQKEWSDNLQAVSGNQSKLAEQTQTLMRRLGARGLTGQNRNFKELSENLRLAIEQMAPAAEDLKNLKPDTAMALEQKSLQYLMRAEALFTEIQVSQGQQGGGGGGGRQSAEDLADLFELELDQNKNQYETLQRGELAPNSAELDELARKLKELAERQQKALERRMQQQQGGGSPSGDQMTAQELQRETERLARQLERLSRENNNRQMADVSRALQQASRNMQQQGQAGSPQQQQQAAQQAMEQLQRAQRLLNQGRPGNTEERFAQLQQQAKEMKQRQNQIANAADKLAAGQRLGTPPSPEQRQQTDDINRQKQQLSEQVRNTTEELDSLSQNQENREAAGSARSAANTIRSTGLQNQINQGRAMLEQGYYNYAAQKERQIENVINEIEKQINRAASAANNTEEKKLQEALNQTSETIRRAESIQRRLQQQNGQGQQEGQQGRQGERGQESQQGQQGQTSQQGQQGQQERGERQGQASGSQQGDGRDASGQFRGGVPYGRERAGENAGQAPNVTDPRQWQREWEEYVRDVQQARNALGPNNPSSSDLNRVINAMRNQMRNRPNGNPEEIERLAREVIDPLRSIELDLSRALQLILAKENIRSAQEEEIPSGYKKLVEEYYKKLSTQKP